MARIAPMDFSAPPAGVSTHFSQGKSKMITDYEIHQRRAEKGKRLSSQVTQHRNGFYVRSETGSAKIYNVRIEGGQWKCTCDDFRYRSEKLRLRFDYNCGHILGVQFALRYASVHETRSIEETRERVARKTRRAPTRRSFTTGFVPH